MIFRPKIDQKSIENRVFQEKGIFFGVLGEAKSEFSRGKHRKNARNFRIDKPFFPQFSRDTYERKTRFCAEFPRAGASRGTPRLDKGMKDKKAWPKRQGYRLNLNQIFISYTGFFALHSFIHHPLALRLSLFQRPLVQVNFHLHACYNSKKELKIGFLHYPLQIDFYQNSLGN